MTFNPYQRSSSSIGNYYTGVTSGSEVNIRQEIINMFDGAYPEIPKASIGLLRKMRRDTNGLLIPCECVDTVTKEPDKDRFCPQCLKKDSQIVTVHGVKPIQDIIPGEYVLSGDGLYHLVSNTYARLFTGKIIKIFSVGRGNIPLEITEDHPCYVFRPNIICHQKRYFGKLCNPDMCCVHACSSKNNGFIVNILKIRADEIQLGDYLFLPVKNKSEIDFPNKLYPVWEKYKKSKGVPCKDLPREIDIDKDLMTFLGWYVAEGSGDAPSRQSRAVMFSLHEKEQDIAEDLLRIAKTKFGLEGKIHRSIIGKSIQVAISNSILSRWMHDICGRYSDNKKTPDFIWSVSSELRRTYINAFIQGDGHLNTDSLETVGIVSKRLAEEIYILALLEGYAPSIRFKPAYEGSSGQAHNDSWYIEWLVSKQYSPEDQLTKWRERFFNEEYLFSKVKEVSSYEDICPVYDLTIENSHSFIANGALVHNCYGEGYYWDEIEVQYYSIVVGRDAMNVAKEQLSPAGLINAPLVVFYIRYDVPVTIQDKIVKVSLDLEGVPVVPQRRNNIFRITKTWDYRLDNGKLEYWKVFSYEEHTKYLNGYGG